MLPVSDVHVRHSGARVVRIGVHEHGGAVRAEVADDGHGFDPGAPSPGFGLAGMRERVAVLGGELEVEASEAGTRVAAALPVV